jgi:hypothetical protein
MDNQTCSFAWLIFAHGPMHGGRNSKPNVHINK